jgi:hypothetical protein
MTAAVSQVLTGNRGDYPRILCVPVAANTLIESGWQVEITSTGYVQPAGTGSGLRVLGIAEHSIDNRTAATGGAAGAAFLNVRAKVAVLKYDGTAPKVNDVVFALDNQTVTLDSDTGANGISGIVTYVDTVAGEVGVYMGPHVAGLIAIGSVVAADVAAAEGDIDDLEATVTAVRRVPIPLSAWTLGGAVMTNFADGTVNGMSLVDSEALGIRINPSALALPSLVTSVVLPSGIDLTKVLELHVSACRIGAADTTVVLQGSAFFQVIGAAYDADADAISVDSAALDAATKVAKELVLSIAAADLPASVDASVTFTMAPSSALDADDLVILSTWLEYTPAITAAA